MMFAIAPVPYVTTGIPGFLTPHAVEVHVTKHHQAYVDNANKLVPSSAFKGKQIEDIIQRSDGAIYNNVSQHFNHSFFWKCLTATPVAVPEHVMTFFNRHFQSLDAFKEQFVQKASTIFGSGWCYLASNADKSISINQYGNANNPIRDKGFPILCIDTWEHAWYVDYENRKTEYFSKFWDAVDWNFVGQRLKEGGLL